MGEKIDWIEVSGHAAERWHERTDSPGVGPIVAWSESERRQVRDLHGDEIRYHRPTQTLLIMRDGMLVTVIDAESARQSIRQDIYGRP